MRRRAVVALGWVLVFGVLHACVINPAGATGSVAGPKEEVSTRRPWVRPVDGYITRRFEHPDRYGPGHRGVTFGAPAGAPVRAAGDGTVVFSGTIAGVVWISVDHANGLRTTYGHLGSVFVLRGQRVRGGDLIADVGASGELHFGVRRGDDYLDPIKLFDDADTGGRVRLVTPRGLLR